MNDDGVSLTLMFNAQAPHIHFVLSAGQKIDIKVPGMYEVIPISLNKIVGGYSTYKELSSQSNSNEFVQSIGDNVTNAGNAYNNSTTNVNDSVNIIEEPVAGNIAGNILETSQDIQPRSATTITAATNSVLELNQPQVPEQIRAPISGGNPINLLFTQNLSKLLVDARYK